MINQFRLIARRGGRWFRVALISLLTLISGCDDRVAWKGVGTDSKDGAASRDGPGNDKTDGNKR